MKKRSDPDELRKEYTLDDFPGGLERGKYAARMAEGSNIVRLDPDIACAFPDSASVNDALRSLLRIAELASASTKRSSEISNDSSNDKNDENAKNSSD